MTKSEHFQYTSQPSLNQAPVYSNIQSLNQTQLSKSQSYSYNLNKDYGREGPTEMDDLHLDNIVLSDNHVIVSERKRSNNSLNNDMTIPEKENVMLSATRLRLLQDTTMIESALDLDSLDDTSVGNNSQAALMKVLV